MRYVIIRDDDTNALTPVEHLERLYRPFIKNKLPVNLATIPNASTRASLPNGQLEGFLLAKRKDQSGNVPIHSNKELIQYLHSNPEYKIVQHGYQHDYMEFSSTDRQEVIRRLEHGTQLLMEAGFPKPQTFVAPHDKFSPISMRETAKRFRVISTGWFELRRLPRSWWPKYLVKKALHWPHWSMGKTVLLSHPGCLLSYNKPCETMVDEVVRTVEENRLTVLVTHWWEYFYKNQPNEPFIECLHQVADYLANASNVRVISFDDVANGKVPFCMMHMNERTPSRGIAVPQPAH